jgi:hypothetical protein
VIDGITGKTNYLSFPTGSFSAATDRFSVRIGDSLFERDRIILNISDEGVNVAGELKFKDQALFRGTLFSPGIMGWYSFVPFMECKHGIVSANHEITGTLAINGKTTDFSGGKGYIEKDWGRSFPEAWLWCQANNFRKRDASLFISVAKIPWLGRHFTGLIAFLYIDGRFRLFATYNGSVIEELVRSGKETGITLRKNTERLKINIVMNGAGDLKAPVSGKMNRIIKESIDSDVSVELYDNDNLVFSDYSRRAGLEIIETIFGYIENMKK